MKVTIEYDLDEPDNKRLLDLALKADKYNIALFDITHNLKKRIEARMDVDKETLGEVIREIVGITEEAGLTFEDLEYHANG